MSIRSDYNPEAERIKKIDASVEQKLGPLWFCTFFTKSEQTLITRMNLHMLTDEEKCYALDKYRNIKNSEREERERKRVVELKKRRDRGGLIVLAILVLIGMLIAIVAGEAKERRLKNAATTVNEMK